MISLSKGCQMIPKRPQSMQLVSGPCPENLSVFRAFWSLQILENLQKILALWMTTVFFPRWTQKLLGKLSSAADSPRNS